MTQSCFTLIAATISRVALVGMLFLASHNLASSELDNDVRSIDLIPQNPSTSDLVSLQIVDLDELGTCISVLAPRSIIINALKKQVQVSLPILTFLPPCPHLETFTVPLGNLGLEGEYEVSIYIELSVPENAESVLFNEENLIGSIPLTVRSSIDNQRHEIPSDGSIQSGVGIISGWACDASRVEISIDGGGRIPISHGNPRGDTSEICGDSNNGYARTQSWGALAKGMHQMETWIDGKLVSTVDFEVSGLGQKFTKGLSGTYVLDDFPAPGESVTIEWSEPHQNFIIVGRSQ